MGGSRDQPSEEPRSTAGAGRPLGSYLVLVAIPFLSRESSPCFSHLGACLKCLVKGLLHWFSTRRGVGGGVILLPPLPRGTLAMSETFLVVTAGVVLLAGCC